MKQTQEVLFKLLTLQIAPIHLLYLNCNPRLIVANIQRRIKPLSFHPLEVVQFSALEREAKAMYRCAKMLHTMLTVPVKLLYQ